MTVSASAPTRIDLAGGTIDIWPVCQLLDEPAVTVNVAVGLRAEVSLEATTTGFLRIDAEEEQIALPVGQIRHDRFGLITRLVEHFGAGNGLDISVRTKAPPRSGLGGSSALAVALGGALARLHAWEPATDEFLGWVQNIETRLLKTPTGYQDYVPALLGGFHTIVAAAAGVEHHPDPGALDFLEGRIHLVDTAVPHHSGMNNWQVVRAFLEGDAEVARRLNAINACARRLGEAIAARDLEAVADAIDAEWKERRRLSPVVTNETIERILAAARDAGALAGKICGAGGGGCLLLVAEDAEPVLRAAEGAGGRPLSFSLTPEGLRWRLAHGPDDARFELFRRNL